MLGLLQRLLLSLDLSLNMLLLGMLSRSYNLNLLGLRRLGCLRWRLRLLLSIWLWCWHLRRPWRWCLPVR